VSCQWGSVKERSCSHITRMGDCFSENGTSVGIEKGRTLWVRPLGEVGNGLWDGDRHLGAVDGRARDSSNSEGIGAGLGVASSTASTTASATTAAGI